MTDKAMVTPQMILDTAAWSQSEQDLRDTLRMAAEALSAALAQAGQPVAWMRHNPGFVDRPSLKPPTDEERAKGITATPLYAHPPAKREAGETEAPQSHVSVPDTATVARHMKDFETAVARMAPKLHWKVWQDLGADPSRYNGGYDGWQHGFGQALFGPLPLPQLIEEMKASLSAKVALATTEGSDNG